MVKGNLDKTTDDTSAVTSHYIGNINCVKVIYLLQIHMFRVCDHNINPVFCMLTIKALSYWHLTSNDVYGTLYH